MSGGHMHDAIVIGAGHNGLAAAVHLAAKGWKVAVVERSDEAGGEVHTPSVRRGGLGRSSANRRRTSGMKVRGAGLDPGRPVVGRPGIEPATGCRPDS
jgi:cation diffusion facilitator CzcD-associated flavoprotein CzcO